MKSRQMRKLLLAFVAVAALATPALATPGAVNAKGCHGKHGRMGYHCHSAGQISHSSHHRYVAGHFFHHDHHKKKEAPEGLTCTPTQSSPHGE